MVKITVFVVASSLALIFLMGSTSPSNAGADGGAGSGAAAPASPAQMGQASAAAAAATSTSVDSAESSAAASAAASAPGTASGGISEAEMQGCILGQEEVCKTLFAKIMRNLNKILTSSYRMTHSLHVFNPNAVRYSLAKAQMLAKVIAQK